MFLTYQRNEYRFIFVDMVQELFSRIQEVELVRNKVSAHIGVLFIYVMFRPLKSTENYLREFYLTLILHGVSFSCSNVNSIMYVDWIFIVAPDVFVSNQLIE